MRRGRDGRPPRGHGGDYGHEYRRGYDAWSEEVAYGRAPGIGGPTDFTPFGWDPMMRWGGWDLGAGFIPYGDTPPPWSYGLSEDWRHAHSYYEEPGVPRRGYDRDVQRLPPRESPTYGRGGDRALRAWARERGYDAGRAIDPRVGHPARRPWNPGG